MRTTKEAGKRRSKIRKSFFARLVCSFVHYALWRAHMWAFIYVRLCDENCGTPKPGYWLNLLWQINSSFVLEWLWFAHTRTRTRKWIRVHARGCLVDRFAINIATRIDIWPMFDSSSSSSSQRYGLPFDSFSFHLFLRVTYGWYGISWIIKKACPFSSPPGESLMMFRYRGRCFISTFRNFRNNNCSNRNFGTV